MGTAEADAGSDHYSDPDTGSDLDSDELVRAVRDAAARVAQAQSEFIALLDRIEVTGAWKGWYGIRSFAHWISHVCEMKIHTAREYIRVMRGLRDQPGVHEAFSEGRVSFSKVREITRLAGEIDEDEAVRMCTYASSAQLSRMVASYRRVAEPLSEAEAESGGEGDSEAEADSGGPYSVGSDPQIARAAPQRLPEDVFAYRSIGGSRVRLTIELPEAEAAEIIALLDDVVDSRIRARSRGAGNAGTGTGAGQPGPRSWAEVGGAGEVSSADAGAGPEHGTLPDQEAKPDQEEPGDAGTERDRAGDWPGGMPGAGAASGADPESQRISRVDCLLQLIRAGSRARPAEESEGGPRRRAEVVVHVGVDTLAQADPDYRAARSDGPGSGAASSTNPAEAPRAAEAARAAEAPRGDAESLAERAGYIEVFGNISPATGARLICESPLVGAVMDASGDVLALGRSRRLASSRQRRALMARDSGCQFPGCARVRLLEAHHIVPWSQGGPTDLDNMLLLCRSHHIAVHEHHLSIRRGEAPFAGALRATSGFVFTTESGAPLFPRSEPVAGRMVFDTATAADPERICTVGGGEGFDLANCVSWIFDAAQKRRVKEQTRSGDGEKRPSDRRSGEGMAGGTGSGDECPDRIDAEVRWELPADGADTGWGQESPTDGTAGRTSQL